MVNPRKTLSNITVLRCKGIPNYATNACRILLKRICRIFWLSFGVDLFHVNLVRAKHVTVEFTLGKFINMASYDYLALMDSSVI